MKKLFMYAGMVAIFAFTGKSEAQVRVNINIGDQPSWRPAGYDYAEYYYMPDIETYYYVPQRQFIYMSNGRWEYSALLPSRYRGYDLHNGYKVVINRPYAYRNFEEDRYRYGRTNYSSGDGYREYQRHDNGRHNGWYKKGKNKNML